MKAKLQNSSSGTFPQSLLVGLLIFSAFCMVTLLSCGGGSSVDSNKETSAPTAIISSPADNQTFNQGENITFSGSAQDDEDGELSGNFLVWTSSIDGQIGTGKLCNKNNLSPGAHTITLTATDKDQKAGTASVAITINQNIGAPTAAISSPGNNQTFNMGDTITFSGSGQDDEDGALSGNFLVWTSSIDGQIGTGTTCNKNNLSPGTHTITLTAADKGGKTDIAQVVIIVAGILGGNGDDMAYAVEQTSDGGFIMAGSTETLDGDIYGYIGKFNSKGNREWKKSLGGTDSSVDFVEFYSIEQTSDNGYIAAGYKSTGGISSDFDFYIVAIDPNGTIKREKTFGKDFDTNNDGNIDIQVDDEAHSIRETSDHGYIVAGYTTCEDYTLDFYIMKLDPNCDKIWEQTFDGNGDDDEVFSIRETSDHGYIAAGYTTYVDEINGYYYDVYIVKLNSDGNLSWEKTYNGSDTEDSIDDVAYSIRQTSDGGYIVAGYTTYLDEVTEITDGDVLVMKLDSAGEVEWQKSFNRDEDERGDDVAYSILQTSDGGYIVAGYSNNSTNSDMYILKLTGDGVKEWDKSFDGGIYKDDVARAIRITADGGYIIAGSTTMGDETNNIYMIKLDSNGNKIF